MDNVNSNVNRSDTKDFKGKREEVFRRAYSLACLVGLGLCALFLLVEIAFGDGLGNDVAAIFAGMSAAILLAMYKNSKAIGNLITGSALAIVCVVFIIRVMIHL